MRAPLSLGSGRVCEPARPAPSRVRDIPRSIAPLEPSRRAAPPPLRAYMDQ
jgi:hypothetical protein